jgi:hypothetical protein
LWHARYSARTRWPEGFTPPPQPSVSHASPL